MKITIVSTKFSIRLRLLYPAFLCLIVSACAPEDSEITGEPFTVVMLPDTQNAVNFQRQKVQGFAIDSSEIFITQMQYIADNAVANGGNVVFVASVGDVWQHGMNGSDPEHVARGILPEPNKAHRNVNRDRFRRWYQFGRERKEWIS